MELVKLQVQTLTVLMALGHVFRVQRMVEIIHGPAQ